MESRPIKVLIADDHPIVREALRGLLEENGLPVVAEAINGTDVLAMLEQHSVDVLIIDMCMPGHPSGLELIGCVCGDRKRKVSVIVFSMLDDEQIISEALQAGASGYVTKDSDPATIVTAIEKVVASEKYICPAVASKMLFATQERNAKPPHELLTKREYQILLMILGGKSMDEIADELFISRQTVGTHKFHLMNKLGLRNNIEMVRYAIKQGLFQP